MTRYPLLLVAVFAGLGLAGCAPAPISPTATVATPSLPAPTKPPVAVPQTPIPSPQASATAGPKAYDYQILYQDGAFTIREAFLGTDAIWKPGFQMPQARIANSVQSLGLGRDMSCDAQPKPGAPCTQKLQVARADGALDDYTFRLDSLRGGAGALLKNGRLIWSGATNGANSYAILSSRRIGDEIAFDYMKSNWGSGDANVWISESILLTTDKSVVLIPNAFAPYPIGEKLIYFRVKTRRSVLVFDGKEVGKQYDAIFNQMCCWGGPPILIAADGQMIDFFAQQGRDWYHVQAGYLKNIR